MSDERKLTYEYNEDVACGMCIHHGLFCARRRAPWRAGETFWSARVAIWPCCRRGRAPISLPATKSHLILTSWPDLRLSHFFQPIPHEDKDAYADDFFRRPQDPYQVARTQRA